MHYLKLLMPVLFFLFTTSLYADDNNINGSCPGEVIEELDGTTVSASHTENGAIGGGGNDRYRINFPVDGNLSINITNRDASKNARYDFYLSRNSCGNNDSDWNIISAQRGTTHTANITVNAGDTIYIRLQSRKSEPTKGRQAYALALDFTLSPPPPPLGAFTQKYTTNLKGNIKVIGNTVLQFNGNINGNSNAQLALSYVNIDSGGGRFNSSSATINSMEAGVDISNARIKWAGLYWQGYLHNDTTDTGLDNVFNFPYNRTANTQIPNAIQNQTVLLKVNNNAYTQIAPQQLGIDQQYGRTNGNYISYKYAAFANVTSILQNNAPNATYTLANIPTRSGRTSSGNTYDGLGNYGAWSLVVVYDNNVSLSEKTRNITIFDGYTVLSAANNPNQTVNLSGFKTPKNAPNGVDSTLSVFAGEGDRNILGDFARLTNQDGYTWNLPDTSGAGSYFASVIEGVPNRNPIILNNNGIDIHTTQVGTSGGADRPIKTNQTSASVTLGTTQDTFMPSMISFATELFSPQLCYDYDVRIGSHIKIPSDNREVHTAKWGNDPLILTLLIRSKLSDFPIENSKLNVTFSPSMLHYLDNSSEVSPPDVNSYHPIDEIDLAKGQIGIGRGATDTNGGTIGALESTYAKQKFSFVNGRFDGTFDLTVEGTIQFDPNSAPVPYTLSTAAPVNSPSYIPRCNTNPVYNPIWANFNIERPDSDSYTAAEKRYPLYTQIAGKDFNISVVSYTLDGSGEYTVPYDTNATVELEIINASVFDNNASAGYDSTCEEPGAIGNGAFINFAPNGARRSRINIRIPQDIPNFNNDVALKNAAFRVWVLATREANGTKSIVHHACTLDGTNPNCFKDLYQNRIRSYDTANHCQTGCETAYAPQTCYNCLREYFAVPICSRDNFAIRPESFRIKISDNNESNITQKQRLTDNSALYDTPNKNLALAAGYKYAIEANATLYNVSDNVRGYYNDAFKAEENISSLGDKTKNNTLAALEFKDNTACKDQTHRTYAMKFQNGKLGENTYIYNNNVGKYVYWMLDSNWTNVDQPTYPYKARFGICKDGRQTDECTDCDIQDPSTSSRNSDGKLGCAVNSNLTGGDLNKNNNYREIPLRFEPYQFDLSDINISLPNAQNFVYTNNITAGDIPNLSMAVNFNGYIVAKNKKGNTTNNFTNSCAAHPVIFDINRSMSSGGTAVDEHNIKGKDIIGSKPDKKIFFQRNYIDGTNENYGENNDTNGSLAVTVTQNQFKNEDNGSAKVNIYYNFTKSYDHVTNPIKVNFIAKEANSTAARSAAHLRLDYLPKGNSPVNKSIDFYYGRIIPGQVTPYSASPDVDVINVPVFVDVYCNNADINCSQHQLTGSPRVDNWWANTRHDSTTDGQILNIIDTKD